MNQPVTGVPQMLPTQVIDTSTDSREILKHARLAARRRKLHEWFVVDVDAHHVETVSWNEIVQYIDDPVVRDQALHFQRTASVLRPTASTAISACATRASAAASRIRTACARRSRKPASIAT